MKTYKNYIFIAAIGISIITFLFINQPFQEEVIPEGVMNKAELTEPDFIDIPNKPKAQTISIQLEREEAPPFKAIFTTSSIGTDLFDLVNNNSFVENNKLTIDDLRYLQVSHWGYDDLPHYGDLIVHKTVAEEILEIFKELYVLKFPIEKIRLIDHYASDDLLSMIDNNTSSFNFREIHGTTAISNHGYGLAIDINPVQNPFIKGGQVLPENGINYISRDLFSKGMITKDGPCYNLFISRGWHWGGNWNSLKDYQHFEKKVEGINAN